MGRYTDAQFQRDIKQLEKLIGGFSGGASNNGNKQRVAKKTGGDRSFTVVRINNKPVGKIGRYVITPSQDPSRAAKRAFLKQCARLNLEGTKCTLTFTIQETTRGSNKKEYTYRAKRVNMKKPHMVVRKDGTKYMVKHQTEMKKVGTQHNGGWKFYS